MFLFPLLMVEKKRQTMLSEIRKELEMNQKITTVNNLSYFIKEELKYYEYMQYRITTTATCIYQSVYSDPSMCGEQYRYLCSNLATSARITMNGFLPYKFNLPQWFLQTCDTEFENYRMYISNIKR